MSRIQPAYSAYGAIDLGTNNCRLLVARPSADGFEVIDAFSRIVRLGEGLSDTQLLCDHAIDRTIEALKICHHRLLKRSVDFTRCVATEACRRAKNSDSFLERVRTEVGLEFEIITPHQEAELALRGCWPLVDTAADNLLLFDIGGGSTEVMWVTLDNRRLSLCDRMFQSWPIGVVGLSERFSDHNGLDRRAYWDMVEFVVPHFEDLDARHSLSEKFERTGLQLIGTSGTMTTLAAVQMGLTKYDRRLVDGQDILWEDYRLAADDILDMSQEDREAHPCIGPGRADLVIAGCAILEALSQVWPCQKVRVADRGLREGMLTHMMRDAARGNLAPWSQSQALYHTG